jgi:hypothetical protein
MSDHLLTGEKDALGILKDIKRMRMSISYDIINHPHCTEFEELDVLLGEVENQLEKLVEKLSTHVYAFDVTLTHTLRVYVKGSDEDDAEEAAIEYALRDMSPSLDWSEDDISSQRREDEETTRVYDVEV